MNKQLTMGVPSSTYSILVCQSIHDLGGGRSSPGPVVAVYDPDADMIHEHRGESRHGANHHPSAN